METFSAIWFSCGLISMGMMVSCDKSDQLSFWDYFMCIALGCINLGVVIVIIFKPKKDNQ